MDAARSVADRRIARVAPGAFVALGMPKAGFAVAWPSMAVALDRPVSDLGLVIAVFIVGFLVSAPLSGHAVTRWGTGPVLVAASAVSAVALAGYATAESWPLFLPVAFLLGLCGGLIDPGLNAYVAVHHDVRAMGWLHAGFGVGAALGPLLMTSLLAAGLSWRLGFWILAAVQVAVTIGLARVGPSWRPVGAPRTERSLPLWRRPIVLAVLAVFLFYTGVEVGAGQWAFTLFTEHRDIPEAAAGFAVTAFWLALTGTRILLGLLGHRTSPVHAAAAGGVATLAAFALMWWSPADWVGLGALVVAGAALGPLFPLQMQMTPLRVGADTAAVMVGYQMVAAGTGAILIPGGIGLAAGAAGLGVIAPILVAGTIAMLLTGEVVRRLSR